MEEESDNEEKWKTAGDAVNAIVSQFAGQLAFGAMLFPRWPEVDGCTEGQVNVTPQLSAGPSIANLLAGVSPFGKTPIAATLDEASAFFASQPSKPRYVILITDGMETCRVPSTSVASGSCIPILEGARKCSECGVQYCDLFSAEWSDCEPDTGNFPCLPGATCQADATCSAGGSGSASATVAAGVLTGQGITTYVVGFGSGVDGPSLNAIATTGGSGAYHQANNMTQLTNALDQIASVISCCGNGQLDPGEKCDTAFAVGNADACPSDCDDGDACTTDTLVGKACQAECDNAPITAAVDGDGCCPPGQTPQTDSDCVDPCGNGTLDAGELCDPGISSGQGVCPDSCFDNDPCTTDTFSGTDCSLQCVFEPLPADPSQKDGCCPKGLTDTEDADCLPPCNPDLTQNCVDLCAGVSCDPGEQCDRGVCVPLPDLGTDGGLTEPINDKPRNDAGIVAVTGSGAGNDGEMFESGGCSCQTPAGGGARGGLLLALMLTSLSLRRRRRD
jgi:MYXO-CTERM domain-containing protein